MKKTRIALIPAYQPEPVMLELLQGIVQNGFQAIVVNDGSGDKTEMLFRKAAAYATILTHTENHGKGCALKTGLAYIQEHFSSDYVVVTLDADGQHTVSDAIRVCEAAEENPGTLILGSRRLEKNVPLRSRFGNTVTRFVYRLSTGSNVYDTQTGLRGFDSRLVPALADMPGERYEYEMNVLLLCSRRNIPIQEITIETIYMDNNASSHFDTLKDSYRIYKEILTFSASSLICFLVDYGLYSLLLFITSGLPGTISLRASNIGARVISASVNYNINRKLVFRSKSSIGKSALQYFVLAAAILAGNTLVLGFLTEQIGLNAYIAKLCTEILFFILSWWIQRCFIFQRKEGS